MKIRSRTIALIAAATPALAALAAPSADAAAPAKLSGVTAVAQRAATTPTQIKHVLDYWTPQRRAAIMSVPLEIDA